MKSSIVEITLIAAALLMSANQSFAADNKTEAATTPKATTTTPKAAAASKAKASAPSAKPKQDAASANVKLVDINSAGKDELKTLPGIGDREAAKIIAGRPYLSKAFLLTQKIITEADYQRLKKLIIAKQNNPTSK